MYGDFSRGHRPDARRGETYLRGFAQQRRLLLDSDVNAFTDALHERLRGLASHLGCPKGSPDFGYLVTPGRLLAVFRELEGVVVASNNVTLYRDYLNKYLDRYPSLRLQADQGGAGSATIRLRAQANGDTVVWCRAEAATGVMLSGGVPLNVPANAALQPVVVALAAVQDLVVDLGAGQAIWIGLIETREPATLAPVYHFADGHFYLDGLPLVNADPAAIWTTAIVPPAANFQVDNPARDLAANDLLLAYLEGSERHVTAVEDGGLLEHALGGDSDTTTRGRAIGRVKLAWVPPGFDPEAFARALDHPVVPNGTLDVTTPQAPPPADPCALPVQGGYTGRDHRFYRFEVHTGGAVGAARIKWSRDNGAELFAVTDATDQVLTFAANTPGAAALRPGDLVEVLTADSIELGDAQAASLDAANDTFTPAVRAVGELVRLQAGAAAPGGVSFTMREPDGVNPVVLAAHFGGFPTTTLKVRRWHGVLTTAAGPIDIEHGIQIQVAGTFAPSDYWQYEARAEGAHNAPVPQNTPHGPERDFAPLALLQFTAVNQPLVLERWLDDRYPPLCELTADDIAFDGDHIGSGSDTVQEIIEEIWHKVGGGCCDATLEPPAGDAAAEIRQILQSTQGDIKICLEPGVYTFTTALDIGNRTVTLKGCPRAVLAANGVDPMLRVLAGGALRLEDLTVFARRADGARVLVDVANDARAFDAQGAGFFIVPDPADAAAVTIVVRVGGQEPTAVTPAAPVPDTPTNAGFPGPALRFTRTIAAASWVVSAPSLQGFAVTGCAFSCATGCVWAESITDAAISDSNLLAGMALDAMLAWTAAAILAGGSALVATLPSIGNMALAEPASIALRIRRLSSASVRDTRMAAGIGLAATETSVVETHANLYAIRYAAVYLVNAGETTIKGESFIGWDGGTAAVQVLASGGVSIADCTARNFAVAFALGGNAAGQSSRAFHDVQVENNQIDQAQIGVQLGPSDGNAFAGELRHVAIAGNTINAHLVGVLVNAQVGAVNAPNAPIDSAGVRVADNTILARAGVAARGTNVEVADNRIALVTGVGARFGILAQATLGFVCDANHVELKPMPALDVFAKPLTKVEADVAGAVGAYIGPGNTLASAAVAIVGGSLARVVDNTTQARGGTILGLSADDHDRLSVKSNDFQSGGVTGRNVDDIVLLDNTVAGDAVISDSASGQVCDNRIRAVNNATGNFSIGNATGTWKAADNRVDATFLLYPPLQFGPWWDLGDLVAPVGVGFRPGVIDALASMSGLAGDARFTDLVFAPAPGGAPPVPAPGPAPPADRAAAPGTAAYVMGSANWVNDYSAALADFVAAGVRPDLGGIVADIGVIVARWREQAFQVMCTANWARRIRIGHPSSAFVNTVSTVQVVTNRAEEDLSVKRYPRLVMAHNVASAYPLAGTAGAAAIEQPNLQI